MDEGTFIDRKPSGVRVLIADQNDDFVASFAILLRSAGYEVHSASTGREVMDLLAARQFDALVLSIVLPDASGYDLARHARRDSKHANALLVALTGWSFPGDSSAALEAGFDNHFLKPVDFGELERTLRSRRGVPKS
jgi:DNA-binding response OmpR family regulator